MPKLRFAVALLMLALGFLGVVLTDIESDGAWHYWRALAVIYAALSLALSLYLKHQGLKASLFTIWHEIAHWLGLILAISVVSYFVNIGLISRFVASLQILPLLALATYLAGIYIEMSFIPIGISLGCFAVGIAFLDQYLYNILIPLTLLALIILAIIIHRSHQKSNKSDL
jgi:hypothetical protein